MKQKKTGATLLTVITFCSAILITGTALVALTGTQFIAKQEQSNRVHNLYGADSGLDAAYDALVADFDAAGNYAKSKVDKLKAGNGEWEVNVEKYKELDDEEIRLQKKMIEDDTYTIEKYERDRKEIEKNRLRLINSEFKRSFKEYLADSDWLKSSDKQGAIYDIATNPQVKPNINYTTCDEDGIKTKNVIVIGDADNFPTITVTVSGITTDNNGTIKQADENEDIVVFDKGLNEAPSLDNFKIKQYASIVISSEFKTTNGQNGQAVVGENARTVQTKYNIVIPNYDDIYFTQQENPTYMFNNLGLTVFGNMLVKDIGESNFSVDNGKVYVYGDPNNIPSGVNIMGSTNIDGKYKGGLIFTGNDLTKSNITFNDEVYTAGTFNVQDNVNVKLIKNLYAANVYAGNLNGTRGNNSILDADSIIVDNDLTLKATKTDISVNNFYGINDKNDSLDGKSRNSSSIIVNTYQDEQKGNQSTVKINNSAYILGVSYIDTTSKYQTGESVGVKGNYNAYSGESENENSQNIKYSYGQDGTLYLINGKVTNNNTVDPNVTLDQKAQHFANFWSEDKNKDNLQDGGVSLPMIGDAPGDIHAVGAIVYRGKDGKPKTSYPGLSLDSDLTIAAKRSDFAKNVYNLGSDIKAGNDFYAKPPNKETIISNFMNLTRLDEDMNGKGLENDGNVGLFNKTNTNKVVVLGKNSTYSPSGDDIVISASSGAVNAFIVTAGDVILDGDVTLTGSIIAQGNLIVQGAGDKKIIYSDEVSQAIQRVDPKPFLEVFKTGTNNNVQSSGDGIKLDYDLNKYLKNLLWKINDNAK